MHVPEILSSLLAGLTSREEGGGQGDDPGTHHLPSAPRLLPPPLCRLQQLRLGSGFCATLHRPRGQPASEQATRGQEDHDKPEQTARSGKHRGTRSGMIKTRPEAKLSAAAGRGSSRRGGEPLDSEIRGSGWMATGAPHASALLQHCCKGRPWAQRRGEARRLSGEGRAARGGFVLAQPPGCVAPGAPSWAPGTCRAGGAPWRARSAAQSRGHVPRPARLLSPGRQEGAISPPTARQDTERDGRLLLSRHSKGPCLAP